MAEIGRNHPFFFLSNDPCHVLFAGLLRQRVSDFVEATAKKPAWLLSSKKKRQRWYRHIRPRLVATLFAVTPELYPDLAPECQA